MRCQAKITVWFKEFVFFTELIDGTKETFPVQRITTRVEQCPIITRQTSAKCWKELSMCGRHAAMYNPLLYPRKIFTRTGGRYGLNKTPNLQFS